MDSTNAWVNDFAVTPVVTHAVDVLRQAIPRDDMPSDSIGMMVSFANDVIEYGGALVKLASGTVRNTPVIQLTDQQKAAAHMLVSMAAVHYECLASQTDGVVPSNLQLTEDIRRKLNVELDGYYYDGLSGSVTIYV